MTKAGLSPICEINLKSIPYNLSFGSFLSNMPSRTSCVNQATFSFYVAHAKDLWHGFFKSLGILEYNHGLCHKAV